MAEPLISASYSLLGRLLGDLLKTAGQSLAKEIEILNTPSKIKSLARKLAQYEQVKTINSPDKSLKISDFFVSPRFMDCENVIFNANTVSDFGDSEHPLIEGIAGQGKSIFMRHLLIEEIKLGQRLPILIELRKITPEKGLKQFALQFLETLGFRSCEDIWNYVLETGFAVLLLDGYDEMQEECRIRLIDDINVLAIRYDQLRIVVSSRPEPSITSLSCLKTIRMCRLDKSQRNEIIWKVCDQTTAASLVFKLSKNDSLGELVDTPLFATLLSVVYRAELRLPETVHEFYDLLFQELLYRHDDCKEGYERPRKSGLGSHVFRIVFENFCFRTALNSRLRLSREAAAEIFSLALENEGADPSLADLFFTDVTKITCLLVRDGSEYQFLHKSIQEYFAAGFIKRLPEEKAIDFYRKILVSPHRMAQFFPSIKFLCEIDSYRAYKYFMLPGLSLSILQDEASWSELPDYEWPTSLIFDIAKECLNGITTEKLGKGYASEIAFEDSITTRRILLEEFDLTSLVIRSIADLLVERFDRDPRTLWQLLSDDPANIFDTDNPETLRIIRVKCSRPLLEVVQDKISAKVNQSPEMYKFRQKVSAMLELLWRKEDLDLLDQV